LNGRFWRAAARWRPFSVTSFGFVSRLEKLVPPLGMVVDGGANIGQFARAVVETWPDADVLAIEPNPDASAKLTASFQGDDRVQVVTAALGSTMGTQRLNITDNSVSSSLLVPSRDAGFHTIRTDDVTVTTLDAILGSQDRLRRPLMVKLDLQGYEYPALEGAQATIETYDYLLLEVSFATSYVGEPLADDVIELVRASSDLRLLAAVDSMHDREGALQQADLLFGRAQTPRHRS
jgi:FkbM family methyltransferase